MNKIFLTRKERRIKSSSGNTHVFQHFELYESDQPNGKFQFPIYKGGSMKYNLDQIDGIFGVKCAVGQVVEVELRPVHADR